VLEAMTRVYGKMENSIPSKYKMTEDIQMPTGIYDYVVELSFGCNFVPGTLKSILLVRRLLYFIIV